MLWFLFFLFLFLYVAFNISTLPYSNPYTLTMIFGKKGSGKTTTMTKLAFQAQRKGKKVYSNVPLPGCFLIKDEDVGFKMIPPDSVLLIDEVGMIWDNRQFKNFKPEVRDWFKLQRHYRVKVYLFSQTFDIDKKLRDLTDEMYLIEKKFRIFAYGKRIMKRCVLTEATSEQPSRIDENLKFDSFLFFWAGARTLTLIPRWADSFDSFEAPPLPVKKYPLDAREFAPVPRRVVYHTLLANFFHIVCADRLARWAWRTRERVEEAEDVAPEEIDFEDFFSHRPEDEG